MSSKIAVFLALAAVVSANSRYTNDDDDDNTISCYIGDSKVHEVIPGFVECVAVFDFESNTVSLLGRHHSRHMSSSDDLVPEMQAVRQQECTTKKNSRGMKMVCRCSNEKCNRPATPKELIEESFNLL